MHAQTIKRFFYLLVIILVWGSCISQKQANSPEMYARRKAFTAEHGRVMNHLFDRPRPMIFR